MRLVVPVRRQRKGGIAQHRAVQPVAAQRRQQLRAADDIRRRSRQCPSRQRKPQHQTIRRRVRKTAAAVGRHARNKRITLVHRQSRRINLMRSQSPGKIRHRNRRHTPHPQYVNIIPTRKRRYRLRIRFNFRPRQCPAAACQSRREYRAAESVRQCRCHPQRLRAPVLRAAGVEVQCQSAKTGQHIAIVKVGHRNHCEVGTFGNRARTPREALRRRHRQSRRHRRANADVERNAGVKRNSDGNSAIAIGADSDIMTHYPPHRHPHINNIRRQCRSHRRINQSELHAVGDIARRCQSHRYGLPFALKAAQGDDERFRRRGQTQSRQAKHRRLHFPQHRAVARARSRRSHSRLAPYRHRLLRRQQNRLHKRPRGHRVARIIIGGHKHRALYGLQITARHKHRNIRRRHRQCRRRIVLPRIRNHNRAQAAQSHKRLAARNRRKQRRVCYRLNFQCINRRQRINIVLNRHRPLQQSLQRSRRHRARLNRHRHRHQNFRTARQCPPAACQSRREHRPADSVRQRRCHSQRLRAPVLRAAGVEVQCQSAKTGQHIAIVKVGHRNHCEVGTFGNRARTPREALRRRHRQSRRHRRANADVERNAGVKRNSDGNSAIAIGADSDIMTHYPPHRHPHINNIRRQCRSHRRINQSELHAVRRRLQGHGVIRNRHLRNGHQLPAAREVRHRHFQSAHSRLIFNFITRHHHRVQRQQLARQRRAAVQRHDIAERAVSGSRAQGLRRRQC